MRKGGFLARPGTPTGTRGHRGLQGGEENKDLTGGLTGEGNPAQQPVGTGEEGPEAGKGYGTVDC